ncbi:MAG: CoA-binding protein [Limimaricola sp.]|uniref:acetate--CoA ligase family protein n=1 Tax=Limimaricola sp. TaxID=2211665 RepID=UPI001E1855DE|nr:acetate--CoA ligase family protein [Limimaricola sp.]MBI1417081.1 CoA-binding protein [Limimaricola sp.]
MTRDLSRLLRPASVAVIGGGAWGRAVIGQLDKIGFAGPVWPVNPKGGEIAGRAVVERVEDLPAPPDAVFIGINRDATIPAVAALSAFGAGGAVCFAAGFAEVEDGAARNADLLRAAGEMPILGPNCYGLINALDGAVLWPDQHGLARVDRGVAILTQSSNIAINLTMQQRGLPIGYVVTCGNQAQTSQARIAADLLDDPRVTAIGLHVEGFGDLADWQALARKARARGVPLVALKVGRSAAARAATISHTASLAGGDAGAQALLDRLGIARVHDLPTFLEALKLLHVCGPLPSAEIATISCSGGEASLSGDAAEGRGIAFPPLTEAQRAGLFAALGPRVALANPLDYNTYIWRDVPAMTDAFAAMVAPHLAMTLLIVDFPRADRCDDADWDCTIAAAIGAGQRTGGRIGMVATLPELMPEAVAARLLAAGIVPLNGLNEAFGAIAAAVQREVPDLGLDLPRLGPAGDTVTLTEAAAKAALAAHGLRVPARLPAATPEDAVQAAGQIGFPVVLKGEGFAHKTEAGAVVLNLATPEAVEDAARRMGATGYIVEEMVSGTVAELLVGVVRDPAHGFVLTLGAGGTLTEVWQDAASCLLPASDETLHVTLDRLKVARLLAGFRGAPPANRAAIIAAIRAVESHVLANADAVAEVEVNPLICTATDAIAADALIRRTP